MRVMVTKVMTMTTWQQNEPKKRQNMNDNMNTIATGEYHGDNN